MCKCKKSLSGEFYVYVTTVRKKKKEWKQTSIMTRLERETTWKKGKACFMNDFHLTLSLQMVQLIILADLEMIKFKLTQCYRGNSSPVGGKGPNLWLKVISTLVSIHLQEKKRRKPKNEKENKRESLEWKKDKRFLHLDEHPSHFSVTSDTHRAVWEFLGEVSSLIYEKTSSRT